MTRETKMPDVERWFLIHKLIGAGSFSSVYQATCKATDTEMALKVFKKRNNDNNQVTRAALEIAFLRMLEHPNIVKFLMYDLGRETMFMGMEYAKFGTLGTVLHREHKDRQIPERYVRNIMKQLLSALAYIHEMNICHGDVKPENILIMRDTDVLIKLCDFGLAEVVLGERTRKGSFYYMAPELHLKFPCDVSVDLFSAGIVMFELLFKKKPYPQTGCKTSHIVLLRKRVPLVRKCDLSTRPPLSRPCLDLLGKLLNYDKHQRPKGSVLMSHLFLNQKSEGAAALPVEQANVDHFVQGCACFTRSFDMANKDFIRDALVEATEGIVHIKIHISSIKNDDGFYSYMLNGLSEYVLYCENLEQRLIRGPKCEIKTVKMTNDNIRCMLTTTPNLLTGFDICCVAEMYIRQQKIDLGRKKLSEGVALLLLHIPSEPIGERKRILSEKLKNWIAILENIRRNDLDDASLGAAAAAAF